jgi:hypothetical protein
MTLAPAVFPPCKHREGAVEIFGNASVAADFREPPQKLALCVGEPPAVGL